MNDLPEELPTDAEFDTAKGLILVRSAMIAQYKMTFALLNEDKKAALKEAQQYFKADLELYEYINKLLKVEQEND